ncbi:DUF1997 domain-containing protein [Calothrix sp. PCC 6303]|uniref:DUF1997 domain-containing protein n=1 Tax=Calothrix sp. PCC 6303 TaxID=1170562 RepID=UPI0002A04B44|nr:DUF1997 domain-containing protein [Calothrix sp. PCC 6303]AFZ00942.1 Protein of unknown function DUF1997 [Calothrix sp. PCC 6303]
MISKDQDYQAVEMTREGVLSVTSSLIDAEEMILDTNSAAINKFYTHHSDRMAMEAPANVVADYLNSHKTWFSRCAEPMKVQPLGENGYALVIGRFGAFNYEVEPQIGLELLPSDAGVYRIRTIPTPDYTPPGYDVDYRASLHLVETTADDFNSQMLTHVEWELDLTVHIHFPKFIQRLPKSLIQSTGDRLLNQIVRQVSRRLTRKVQEDFHSSIGVPFSCKRKNVK